MLLEEGKTISTTNLRESSSSMESRSFCKGRTIVKTKTQSFITRWQESQTLHCNPEKMSSWLHAAQQRQFLASSHRDRVCLPLKSLDPPHTVKKQNRVPVFDLSDRLVWLVVSDCGGHARALEALDSVIDGKKVVQVGVDNILQRVQQKLENNYIEAINLASPGFISSAVTGR